MISKDSRILITGGTGFLGSAVTRLFKSRGYTNVIPVRNKGGYDLTREQAVRELYLNLKPDIVIHLAAVVGGIGANKKNPATFYFNNIMMGTLMLQYAKIFEISKFVAIGTICAYPSETPVPFKESDLWNGYPEETNAPYGLAKKMMLVQSQALRQEHGLNSIYLLPVNLYGPGDHFDPETSHVIPGLIRKCMEAKKQNLPSITCWGTGRATREFLYVEDAADAILRSTEIYNSPDPMNIGSGEEISIKNLASLIAALTGYEGQILWDESKPDGQMRRCLDVTKAKKEISFKAQTLLEDGLKETIEWYKNECDG